MQYENSYSQLFWKEQKRNVLREVWKENQHLFHWTPQERALDVGCGPGDMTALVVSSWLPEDYQLLVGADISHTAVNHALKNKESEKLTFEVLDISDDISDFLQKAEFSPGFNKIFSFYVFNWIHDLEKAVGNLFKLLTTGGEMLLFFPAVKYFQKTFMEVRSKDPWKEYSKGLSWNIPPFPKADPVEEFKQILLNAGFEVVKCELKDVVSAFDSVTDMHDLLQSVDPNITSIPLKMKTEYLQHCFEFLQNMGVIRVDGSCIFLTQSTLIVVARKPQDSHNSG